MYLKKDFTPDKIYKLKENQIFVFGSNPQGRHGKGGAKYAKDRFGAIQGQAFGLQGQSYAIITKELRSWKPAITLEQIKHQIKVLFEYAQKNQDKEFLVTKIGCSLAYFSVAEIRSLFKDIMYEKGLPVNIMLPKEFILDI